MDKTVRHIKDAKLGVVEIENFASGCDAWITKGTLTAANQTWKIGLSTHTEDGVEWLSMRVIFFPIETAVRTFEVKKIPIEMAASVRNESEDKWRTVQAQFNTKPATLRGWANFMRMDEILAPSSGFLKDGRLTVQLEILVETIVDSNNVERVNVFDPRGDYRMICLDNWTIDYFVSREVMGAQSEMLHDIMFGDGAMNPNAPGMMIRGIRNPESFETFLQLIYGVWGVFSEKSGPHVLEIARSMHAMGLLRRLGVFTSSSVNMPPKKSQPGAVGNNMPEALKGETQGNISSNYKGRPANAQPNYKYTPAAGAGQSVADWTKDHLKGKREEAREKKKNNASSS